MEFCYTARRSFLTESHVEDLNDSLQRFHNYRRIFFASVADSDDTASGDSDNSDEDEDPGLSLPRQHAMVHYPYLVEMFGAPNGLCTSITEAKHKSAVKEPWRRSNHHDALVQVLLINQRLTKLSELRKSLVKRGLLRKTFLEQALEEQASATLARHVGPLPTQQGRAVWHLSLPVSDNEWQGIEVDGIKMEMVDSHACRKARVEDGQRSGDGDAMEVDEDVDKGEDILMVQDSTNGEGDEQLLNNVVSSIRHINHSSLLIIVMCAG
jgi:hypothetical protein